VAQPRSLPAYYSQDIAAGQDSSGGEHVSFESKRGIMASRCCPGGRPCFGPKCLFPNPEGADLCVSMRGRRDRWAGSGYQSARSSSSPQSPSASGGPGRWTCTAAAPDRADDHIRHVNGIALAIPGSSEQVRKEEYTPEVELPACRRRPARLTVVITTARSTGPKDEVRIFISPPTPPASNGDGGAAAGHRSPRTA